MSKRFISTDIWRKQWFRELSPAMKTFWVYAFTNCDNAGVFELDIGLAEFQIGCQLDIESILSDFKGQIERLSGNKFFICDYVTFQYGELSEDCKPHKYVFSLLEKHGLKERVCKHYTKGINTLKDKDKEKEKEKDKEKESDEQFILPNHLVEIWPDFLAMRKKIKKPITIRGEKLIVKELESLAPGDLHLQLQIIEQSIANSWQGVFPLKEKFTEQRVKYTNFLSGGGM